MPKYDFNKVAYCNFMKRAASIVHVKKSTFWICCWHSYHLQLKEKHHCRKQNTIILLSTCFHDNNQSFELNLTRNNE